MLASHRMPTVKFKPLVKCNFHTSCMSDDKRAARCRDRAHTRPLRTHSSHPAWATGARAQPIPPTDPLWHPLFFVEPCSGAVQAAGPRCELWMFSSLSTAALLSFSCHRGMWLLAGKQSASRSISHRHQRPRRVQAVLLFPALICPYAAV